MKDGGEKITNDVNFINNMTNVEDLNACSDKVSVVSSGSIKNNFNSSDEELHLHNKDSLSRPVQLSEKIVVSLNKHFTKIGICVIYMPERARVFIDVSIHRKEECARRKKLSVSSAIRI